MTLSNKVPTTPALGASQHFSTGIKKGLPQQPLSKYGI